MLKYFKPKSTLYCCGIKNKSTSFAFMSNSYISKGLITWGIFKPGVEFSHVDWDEISALHY